MALADSLVRQGVGLASNFLGGGPFSLALGGIGGLVGLLRMLFPHKEMPYHTAWNAADQFMSQLYHHAGGGTVYRTPSGQMISPAAKMGRFDKPLKEMMIHDITTDLPTEQRYTDPSFPAGKGNLFAPMLGSQERNPEMEFLNIPTDAQMMMQSPGLRSFGGFGGTSRVALPQNVTDFLPLFQSVGQKYGSMVKGAKGTAPDIFRDIMYASSAERHQTPQELLQLFSGGVTPDAQGLLSAFGNSLKDFPGFSDYTLSDKDYAAAQDSSLLGKIIPKEVRPSEWFALRQGDPAIFGTGMTGPEMRNYLDYMWKGSVQNQYDVPNQLEPWQNEFLSTLDPLKRQLIGGVMSGSPEEERQRWLTETAGERSQNE